MQQDHAQLDFFLGNAVRQGGHDAQAQGQGQQESNQFLHDFFLLLKVGSERNLFGSVLRQNDLSVLDGGDDCQRR